MHYHTNQFEIEVLKKNLYVKLPLLLSVSVSLKDDVGFFLCGSVQYWVKM